jgi:hypothetical protein
MPASHSVISLHLKYRLLIAELNFDINVLRIFDDYLTELRGKRKDSEMKSKSDYFVKQFQGFRTVIDEIRHEMQLAKMKLGAFSRDGKPFDYKLFNKENRNQLKKLSEYRANFKKIKKEFDDLEVK